MGRPKKPTEAAAGFVAYYRVSTEEQGQSGLGLEAQRVAVRRHAAGKGEILAEFTEVESGKKNDRPQLAAAISETKRLNATLAIAKLDRLARNVAFIAKLMEDATNFVACDMPGANRLTSHIMAAMAEHERELISQRTKAGLAVVKRELLEKGFRISKAGRRFKRLGNPHWRASIAKARANRKSERSPERIRAMLQRLRDIGASFQKIADEMNALGIRTPSGAIWYPSTVRSELLKPEE